MQTIRDALTPEQRAALDKPARKMLNRGLTAAVRVKARQLQQDEFRPEDLVHVLRADVHAIGASLATLAKHSQGIERVGIGKTGVYRVNGTAPNLEDEDVLDKALAAIAELEALVKRHRDLLVTIKALKKALG